MRTLRKLLLIILIIIFVALVYLFIQIYFDVKKAKVYVGFIRDSANSLIVEVDQVNLELNKLQYDESQQSLTNLKDKYEKINELVTEIEKERTLYEVPSEGVSVDEKFGNYLEEVKELMVSLEQVIRSIETLEEREKFESKLDEYIRHANELQARSAELEHILSEYVQDYTKFDFNKIKDAIPFI